MLYTIEDTLADVISWARETFPDSTPDGRIKHLREEMSELEADPASGEEMADILMILAHHAEMCGVNLNDEVERKLKIVKARGKPFTDETGITRVAKSVMTAGWGKSPASRKWHYFPEDDMFALCRGIDFYFGPREQGNDDSKDNCAACRKKLAVQQKLR